MHVSRRAGPSAGANATGVLDRAPNAAAASAVARALWAPSGKSGPYARTSRSDDGLRRRRAHLPALDGLRAIGIAAVIAYHLDSGWLPGGYLGVDVFFVVSGFLITGILLDLLVPARINARPALREFWGRRARRVLPALVALVTAVAVAASLIARDAVPRLRADIPAALGFVANWRLLFHHDSYFESFGRPPLLLHLWSLGVEEQFYLLWPFAVLLVARLARNVERALAQLAFIGALASAALMALLYVPGHDASPVYYDTFTHASGLLIGAGLCALTRHGRPAVGPRAARRRARAGSLALVGVLACIGAMGASSTFTYRGGILLASALTGVVVLTATQPGPLERLLGLAPLRYLGSRSYSLYLWHWPVICLTRPGTDVSLDGAPLLVLRLLLMVAAAELSYRLVEQPFRRGQVQSLLRGLRSGARTAAFGSAGLCAVGTLALLAASSPAPMPSLLVAGSTPAARARLVPVRSDAGSPTTTTAPTATSATTPSTTVPNGSLRRTSPASTSPTSTTPGPLGAHMSGGGPPTSTSVPAWTNLPPVKSPPLKSPVLSSTATTIITSTAVTSAPVTTVATTPRTSAAPPPTTTTASPPPAKPAPPPALPLGHHYLAIGDSVLLASAPALSRAMHGDITIDALVGRQVAAGINRLAQYRRAGDLRGLRAVIVDLGTNGPMTPADVAQLRSLAAGVPLLVFVNVRVPRPWQAQTNASIDAVASSPGVRVVNWYSASAAPGVFWPDGVHPAPQGQALYARLVATALGAGPAN